MPSNLFLVIYSGEDYELAEELGTEVSSTFDVEYALGSCEDFGDTEVAQRFLARSRQKIVQSSFSLIIADLSHQNPVKYPKQRHYIVFIKNYVYVVPYVRNGLVVFFKTIYPSRKYYKIYIKNAQKAKI